VRGLGAIQAGKNAAAWSPWEASNNAGFPALQPFFPPADGGGSRIAWVVASRCPSRCRCLPAAQLTAIR